MRRAESTGYAPLTAEQKWNIQNVVNVPLYPYQEQTVRWMIDKEEDPHSLNDYFWQRWQFTPTLYHPDPSYFYYFPLKGELRVHRPPASRGGMIAEEMGLGKTIEALALIAAQKPLTRHPKQITIPNPSGRKPPAVTVSIEGVIRFARLRVANDELVSSKLRDDPSQQFLHGDRLVNIEAPWRNVKVERWESHTTLVACPNSLLSQWKQEAQRRAPSLSVKIWKSSGKRYKGDSDQIKYALGPEAKDIILATYDVIRSCPVLSRIYWRRIILDESQVSRRSATIIAAELFNLNSRSRFLMTGTPFVNTLDDLKGQMSILRIWPFSLEKDGFWEQYISSRVCDNDLVTSLLDVSMMRHSKGQNLQVTFPPRTYETIRVSLEGSARALYCYILACCLEDVMAQKELYQLNNISGNLECRRIRVLFKQLMLVCLSPELFDTTWIDLVRRETLSLRTTEDAGSVEDVLEPSVSQLETMTPREAILYVANTNSGVVRSANRARGAVLGGSSNASPLEQERERLLNLGRDELRTMALERNALSPDVVGRTSHGRLVQVILGGVYKLEGDTLKELQETALQMGVATTENVSLWKKPALKARLKLHIEWLNSVQRNQEPPPNSAQVHESGYAALMRLVEKKNEHPNCPVCLMDCESRLAVTKCGHLYCMDCMTMMLNTSGSDQARCAICRKSLSQFRPVEVLRVTDDEDGENEDATVEGDGSSEDGSAVDIIESSDGEESNGGKASSSESVPLNGSHRSRVESLRTTQLHWNRPTPSEAMQSFNRVPVPPSVTGVHQNPLFPSLERKVLQHLMAVHSGEEVAPKLQALHELIQRSEADIKFCVVAGSCKSLGIIAKFLSERGIQSVGSGSSYGASLRAQQGMAATSENETSAEPLSEIEIFENDPDVRVYLLNPSNSSGLTLTRASVVVFMEMLTRTADEVQASARVHRIGQTRPVKVVRIMAENTLEEVVMERRRGEVNSADQEWSALCSAQNAADGLIRSLFWE